MKLSRLFMAVATTTAFSCMALVGCQTHGSTPADMVMRNGYVYTVDGKNSVQQAIAVTGGKIVYVGSDEGVAAYIGTQTQMIDLAGRMLMPGFVDAHMHPGDGGRAMTLCDLKYQTMTRKVFQQTIQACLDADKDKGPDVWLEVGSWDRMGMTGLDGDPDKSTLDALKTTRPIQVRSTDFHTVLTNSRGLAVAGINRHTANPGDGKYVRDSAGNPTGICEDGAADAMAAVVPPATDAEKLNQTRAALDAMRRQGITSFFDALSGPENGKAFTTLQQSGELTARALLAIKLDPAAAAADPAKTIAEAKVLANTYDQGEAKVAPGVSMRHVKLFMDGIINAPADTGAMLTPYLRNTGTDAAPKWTSGNNVGELYFPAQVLNPLLLKAVQAGLDPHLHATGDRAVRDSLNGIEYVRRQLPGNGFRPTITHAESVDPADYGRFKALDVTANMSFQWAQQAPSTVDGTSEHLGADRFARMEPSGSISRAGGRVAYGSDWPVDPLDEFLALKIGVTRSGDPLNPHSYGPKYAGRLNADPALSRADVLKSITMNAAEQLRLDSVVGSIEVGKFADVIVLDKNFMQVPDDELARNDVLLTVVGGKVVWAKAPFVGLEQRAAEVAVTEQQK
ncbi:MULTISPECIES: amidohydrolase [Pseudomonas]|uniref:amidohydrolase n=1 Tax=Pseudomonas TaxID=286 RepID=UPI000B3647B8|nr:MULTISPECIES: amidohydrolase [Pseudomonas]PMY47335.1 hydrolase [Pseudomonas sp. FW305-53]PMY88875.1 hydrolase [Pseudomonas sp. FW303-C2]PMY89673.1 hydrolase [Pseudomonas sp. FW305-62]PNA43015.1 hydrolase [Pseudomonas sp. FW306-2-2C-A10BC]PNA89166.1 hydrolase [Pseudomonas sp. MPR-R3B]